MGESTRPTPWLNYVLFQDEPNDPKTEDAIIARTWLHYIEYPGDDPDPDVILQLPMTRVSSLSSSSSL